tara:strand:+ start:175 stop:306 length:132 start_codon:yes stop_codon:yes gene_type:complete
MVAKFLEHYDANLDGKLDFEEFKSLMSGKISNSFYVDEEVLQK